MDESQQQLFLTIYDQHYETIVRYLIRHSGDVSLAYDLASETFLKALRSFDLYQPQAGKSILAWLYRIALNELRMYWRKQQRYTFEALEDYPALCSQQPTPEHLAILQKDTELLREALQRLEELDRNLISLRYFGELSLEEIVEVTGMKLGTVKSRLSRTIKKLEQQLQPFLAPDIISSVRPD